MFFTGFIVAEEFSLENVFDEFFRNCAGTVGVGAGAADAEFKGVVGGAGVAVGEAGDAEEDFVAGFYILVAETSVFVVEGAAEKIGD